MNTFTTLYNATGCNAGYIENMAQEAATNGYKAIVPEKCGFVLVGQRLVPYTFLELVQGELDGIQFAYGVVLNAASMFSSAFLESLTTDECEVLMPCVLVLIERGDFGLNLFATNDEKALAAA